MTTVKTVAVFAIIFGCFAVLYPKIFHPMLLHLLGMSRARRSADDMSKNIKMTLWLPLATTLAFYSCFVCSFYRLHDHHDGLHYSISFLI